MYEPPTSRKPVRTGLRPKTGKQARKRARSDEMPNDPEKLLNGYLLRLLFFFFFFAFAERVVQ